MKFNSIRGMASAKSIALVALLAVVAAAGWVLVDGPQRALAVPGNDNFASATVIGSLPYTVTQNNAGATEETNEPLPCGSIGATAWWRFTPTVDLAITADTAGSVYDTVLAVYNGNSLTTLVNMGCQNAVSGVGTETVAFTARAGVTYRIQLGGAASASGSATLNVSGGAVGGIPGVMSYQGRLTNPTTGNPVPDGNYSTTFRIFDDATAGSQLWTETQQVAVSGGLFNVLLGGKVPLTASVFSGTTRFLEVQVSGDPAMTPRQRLASVPYAMQASSAPANFNAAGSVIGADVVSNGHIYVNFDGPEGYFNVCFYAGGAPCGAVLQWQNDNDRFQFSNDLHLLGNLTATGTKSAAVSTSQGSRLMYAVESTGSWFEDFGSGQLDGGSAVIAIDSLFGETVNTDVDYHVFLTPLGESGGLYVADKSASSFEVRDSNGSSDIAFDYRIVAKRRGYENDRLEPADLNGTSLGTTDAGDGGTRGSVSSQAAADEGNGGVPVLPIVLPVSIAAALAAALASGWAVARRRAKEN